MITASVGNESLRTYISRINYIMNLQNGKRGEENVLLLLEELREDLRKTLIKISTKRYSKYSTPYWKYVYLPAIQESQLNIYVRLDITRLPNRWLEQLKDKRERLEWYVCIGRIHFMLISRNNNLQFVLNNSIKPFSFPIDNEQA